MAVFVMCFQEYDIRKGHPTPAVSQVDLVNPWDPPWKNSVTQSAESVSSIPIVKL